MKVHRFYVVRREQEKDTWTKNMLRLYLDLLFFLITWILSHLYVWKVSKKSRSQPLNRLRTASRGCCAGRWRMKCNRIEFLHEEDVLILNLYPRKKLSPLWGDIAADEPWHMEYGISLKGGARALVSSRIRRSRACQSRFVTQQCTGRVCVSSAMSAINTGANERHLLGLFHPKTQFFVNTAFSVQGMFY